MPNLTLLAPLDGWCAPLSEVPDAVFSGLMLGDGIAIDPVSGVVKAPCDGEVTTVAAAFSETLRASPTGDLAFICGSNGLPMTKEGFGNAFRKACRAAGIRKSAHGLRKLAATRAADADATIWQLNAMFGWTGTKMAMRYTQASDRKHAAREGFRKLNDARTNCPAPSQKVRDSI